MSFLTIILSLLLSAPRFLSYSAADGLPSNTVYAIAQDGDGVLWIGTRNGLASFDGTTFRSWKEYGRVNALAVDREGRLWVGTDNLIAGSDRQSFGGVIRALHADREGFVWATVGDSLLLKLSYHDGIMEEARCFYDKRDSEGDYPYYQIYEAADGRLWLAGRLVHNQFVGDKNDPHITLTRWEGIPCNGSYAETGGKLYSFEDHTSLLHTYKDGNPIPLGRLPISHARLLTDSKGRLWAAGSYGLGIVDTEHPENTTVFHHQADDPASPSSGELYCIFEDSRGNIWVGGDNGLSVLCPSLQQIKTISRANVTALMQDSSGKMWVGTAEERVTALYEDRTGTVYRGLWNNTGWEVWRNGKMVRKDRLSGPLPEEQIEARYLDGANWISDFLEDREGRFWVVSWEGVGLNEWDREARRSLPPRWLSPFRYPSPQVDSNIYLSSRLGSRLIEDARGNLVYATTQAGINVIDRQTGLVTKYFKGNSSIPDDYVTDLCLAPDGAVWASTRSGLWRMPDQVGQDGVIAGTDRQSILTGMLVQSVEADESGRLWAGTEDGLYFVDTDGTVGRVPKELGLPSEIFGEHVSCALADGSLAFGGSAGAVVFNPDSLLALSAKDNLPLAPLVRHRYRLNGGLWADGRFTGLPENVRPGRYKLQEQSSDIFGRWERGETLERVIRIPLPLWLRWPFLLAYALILLGAVWTVVKLRERRLLVKELDMRNRLFSIISHDLRNPVSGNRLLARELLEQADTLSAEQLKEALTVISKSADNASALLENLLLWSLNQEGMLKPVMRDENMLELAREAADSVLQSGQLIELDIPADLSVRTDRNMLLTVVRNLLDNAIKASPEGGKVTMRAHGKRILIADEGPGLQESGAGWGHGLGLVITRELLDKLGARMEMNNRPEGGLEITIDL
jgi:ligand-binding sensor domain-containing protein/signal transduction histidine kinase